MATRKDRVLNTRIPEELDREIRQQAMKLELSVSDFVREHLQRTVEALGNRAAIVESMIGDAGAEGGAAPSAAAIVSTLRRVVLGWQEVVLQHEARCVVTGYVLLPGTRAWLAVRTDGRRGTVVSAEGLDRVLDRRPVQWTSIVLQQDGRCAHTGVELPRGTRAWVDLDADPPTLLSEAAWASLPPTPEGAP